MQLVAEYNNYNYLPIMDPQEKVDFAILCKELRAAKKYTQQEMADILEVDIRTYKRYEAGERVPGGHQAWTLFNMQQELNKPSE